MNTSIMYHVISAYQRARHNTRTDDPPTQPLTPSLTHARTHTHTHTNSNGGARVGAAIVPIFRLSILQGPGVQRQGRGREKKEAGAEKAGERQGVEEGQVNSPAMAV